MTVRRRCDFKIGEKVEIKIGDYTIGYGKIVRIEKKKVGELTKEDAKMDGFRSRKELIFALKKHYKGLKNEDEVYLIEWVWV